MKFNTEYFSLKILLTVLPLSTRKAHLMSGVDHIFILSLTRGIWARTVNASYCTYSPYLAHPVYKGMAQIEIDITARHQTVISLL